MGVQVCTLFRSGMDATIQQYSIYMYIMRIFFDRHKHTSALEQRGSKVPAHLNHRTQPEDGRNP